MVLVSYGSIQAALLHCMSAAPMPVDDEDEGSGGSSGGEDGEAGTGTRAAAAAAAAAAAPGVVERLGSRTSSATLKGVLKVRP